MARVTVDRLIWVAPFARRASHPIDEIGLSYVVDFGSQGSLNAMSQYVTFPLQVLNLLAGKREISVQTGRRGPFKPGRDSCLY